MTRSPSITDRPLGRRARRGRLLVVGEGVLPASLRRRLIEPPIEVRTVFEAIGEITTVDASRPISTAVIPDAAVGADEDVAGALRRIDPAVKVVRVRQAGATHGWTGADVCVDAHDEPALASAINGMLAEPSETAGAGDAPGATFAAADDAASPEPPPPMPPPPAPTPPATFTAPPEERIAPPPTAPPPVPAATTPAPPVADQPAPPDPLADAVTTTTRFNDADLIAMDRPAPPRRADLTSDLGDTDLVEAIMGEPDGVTPTALALIRQQTGWDDVALSATRPEDDRPYAAVAPQRAPLAWLTSHRASSSELAAWAAWLERWLDLDAAHRAYRSMAYHDELTGAWNRRYFYKFLDESITIARDRRRPITVMVFDIDDFKKYNDQFDHEAGDVILRETVGLLQSVIRSCDRVCRIGGDEFAVIFADLDEPREAGADRRLSAELIARRFQAQVCMMRFPKLGLEAPGTLSISAGLATYPWDGSDPAALLRLADQRALESKRMGKNHITFGPGAASECDDGDPL